jgi:hypothetical protein
MKLAVSEGLLIGWMVAADAALGREFEKMLDLDNRNASAQLSGKPHFRLMILAIIRYGFEESM